jgi:hypothetical protein
MANDSNRPSRFPATLSVRCPESWPDLIERLAEPELESGSDFRPASPVLNDQALAEAVKRAGNDHEALYQLAIDQRQAIALLYESRFQAMNAERDKHFEKFNRIWSTAMDGAERKSA